MTTREITSREDIRMAFEGYIGSFTGSDCHMEREQLEEVVREDLERDRKEADELDLEREYTWRDSQMSWIVGVVADEIEEMWESEEEK